MSISSSRRQFVTAAGLAILALAAPAMARADEAQDKALADIQKRGGKIDRDETVKEKDKPVIAVNFATTPAEDAALESLKAIPTLRKLTLNGTKITDAGLEHVKGLSTLKKLYLVDTKITDKGLESLKDMKELEVLSLVGTGVTDAGVEHLKGLSNLKDLFLYGTKVTDGGIKTLKEALPKTKIDR
jgi:Leucine-rich repeat (LRR) protein